MRHTLLLTTTALALLPQLAAAQVQTTTGAAPSEAVSAAVAPDQSGLGEIIVTAQRRQESSQRAAIPLNVLPGAALLASGVTQADRLNNLAPALSIEPTSTGNLIFIRGVGNFTVVPSSDPAVAFNYDGVYVGRPTSTTGVFYDLDRVEILKGPQGILYGRNATGGAINVLPAQPKIGELGGYVSATYGNYNTINAEGAINVPIGETGAFRLSAMTANHDGYLSDGTSDQKTYAVRAQLKAALTPDLTVRVAADFAHDGGAGSGIDYQGVYAGSTANFIPSRIPFGTGVEAPSSQGFRTAIPFGPLGNRLPPLTPNVFQDNAFYGVNAEIDYTTNAGTLTVIPAWRDAKLNYLSDAGGFLYRDREQDNQYSLEARFAGTRIGPFDYTIGGFYFDERINTSTQLSISNTGSNQLPTFGTKSYAGFGRLTLNLGDRLRLVGGLRYTQDDKTFTTTQTAAIIQCVVVNPVTRAPNCPNAPTVPLFTDPSQIGYAFPAFGAVPIFVGGVPTGALSIRSDTAYNTVLHNHKLTYRGAAEFDLAPRSLLYASVESGYRSGGFSAATGFLTYNPETITAYTIGAKNRFFGNKLQVNVEGFIWDYKNQQVNHVGLDLNGNPANYTQNIGSSRIKGVEVDGKLLVTPTTLLSADVQYLDAKQKNYIYTQGPGAPPITGCAVSFNPANPAPYLIDCSGLPSYNSPKWTLNFSGQQTIKLDPFEIVLTADTQHRSSRYIGFAYTPQQLIGSSWTTNAQVQFGPNSERWSIAAFIRNIENDRIPIYSTLHPTANLLAVGTTAPRTFGVRLSAKY